MAIINTLREKMGRFVAIVVGLAIMAFVLNDLFGPQSSILGKNKREVGEIAGEVVSQQEYAALVEQSKNNFALQYGVNPNEFMMNSIRDQAWAELIAKLAYQKTYEELGIAITPEERVDMVQGRNIAPYVIQNFTNPETGQFDQAALNNFLRQSSVNQQARIQWELFERQIIAARKRLKFENILLKTAYATLAESQTEYHNQLASVDLEYVYVPFFSVPDGEVTVTDSELRTYLENHEEEYQVTESRSIEYVSFPVIPSKEDTASYKSELEKIKEGFLAATDDSTFAIVNTEQGTGYATYSPKDLPAAITDNLDNIQVGEVLGPVLTNGVYSMYKLSAEEDGDTEFVRASHILLKTEGKSASEKAEIRRKANRLLSQLRNGADFGQLARENSEDSSAPTGGDLGWYEKGTGWVAPFENAAFGARRKGLINRLVESQFGYHLMKITEAPTKKQYKVATIQVIMTPSYTTKNTVYQQAASFAATSDSYETFTSNASENGYSVFSGQQIAPNNRNIGRLNNARSIVSWLYGEASIGDVKDFELDDEYVVAVYTEQVKEGTSTLESIRNVITQQVRNEKKTDIIKNKLDGLSGSLQEIATAYGADAVVHTATALKQNTISLPNVGTAPEAIGAALALQESGNRTTAIATDNGVVLIELKSKNSPAEIADYTAYETQLLQKMEARMPYNLNQSMNDRAEIKDERYKFY